MGTFLLAALLLFGGPLTASPQLVSNAPQASTGAAAGALSGRILKYGTSVPGLEVTLHQVTPQASGVADQQITRPDGSFEFRLPAADPSGFNVFFVTVEHLGVRYFGEPIHASQLPPLYTVAVYDTAGAAPGAIRVGRRDVILYPETDGSWSANELIRAVNDTERTFVSLGGEPTWEFVLPSGAVDFEVTEGMVGPEELRVIGERVVFTGSLPPGTRELFLRYSLGVRQTSLDLETVGRTDTLSVYLPEVTPGVRVTGLTSTQVITADNERFVRYAATDVTAGNAVRVTWSSTAPPANPVVAAVIVTLAILAIGSWLALRNRGQSGYAGYRLPFAPAAARGPSTPEPGPR